MGHGRSPQGVRETTASQCKAVEVGSTPTAKMAAPEVYVPRRVLLTGGAGFMYVDARGRGGGGDGAGVVRPCAHANARGVDAWTGRACARMRRSPIACADTARGPAAIPARS